jgi:hypothetical protein
MDDAVGPGVRRSTLPAAALLLVTCGLPASPAIATPQGPPPAGDVIAVLMKASGYLAGYVKALSSVVSEERYDQVLVRKGDRNTAGMSLHRTLLSDYLLVAVSGSSEWMAFRDVYSVDGTTIRDRGDRLLKLFVEAPPDAYTQAVRIRKESSRYNIGSGTRDTNVPTFALQILTGEWRGGFTFKLKGHERVGETDAVVVEYLEIASPTLVVGQRDEDVPSRGRFWIDPVDGRILRTLFETRPLGGVNTIEVRFRYEPRLDILVPGEMIERRYAGAEMVEGKATYSNFRRFRVDTTIDIK